MKRYSSYKDSGIEWIGDIPKHWQKSSIRGLTKVLAQRNRPDLPLLAVYRDYGVIYRDSRDDNHNRVPEDLTNYKIVKPGNLVLNKMKTWQGSLGVSEFEGIVSPAYITCEVSTNVNSRFLHYLLRCHRYIYIYNKISYGVRVDQWDMHYEDFKQIPIFLPLVEEQKSIAHFLDRKLEQIDHFISNKQKLIKLLNEQKTAIINRAVTKGLNPHAPMKPSGIEWLGEIPADWEIQRLKYLTKRITDGEHISPQLASEGVLLISAKDVRDKEIIYDVDKFVSVEDAKRFWLRCKPKMGDILIVSRGATIGRVAIVENETLFCLMGSVILCEIKSEAVSLFIYFALNSNYAKKSLFFLSSASAQPAIYIKDIAELAVPVPPLQEQNQIIDYLESEAEKIEQVIAKTEKEIELIKEYRTTLISDAVTGKIDVRDTSVVDFLLTSEAV